MFRFSDLDEGLYGLAVDDGVTMAGIEIKAGATVTRDIVLPATARKIVVHYLLFSQPAGGAASTRLAMALALPYLQCTRASAGFSLDEAKRATRVTIVGDGVSAADEEALRGGRLPG